MIEFLKAYLDTIAEPTELDSGTTSTLALYRAVIAQIDLFGQEIKMQNAVQIWNIAFEIINL